MALDSGRYFGNPIVGQPGAGADINVYDTHATPHYQVGFGFTRGDGNKFRYAYTDAATNAGSVVAPVFANSGIATTDNAVIAPASAVAVSGEVIKPGSAGSRYVEWTKSGISQNQLAGGYFITEDGSGKGYTYRIKGNTATDNPATGNIRIELYEKLNATLSPNTDVTIVPCMWNDVKTATVATDWAAAGVLMATTTSSKPYAWVCTHGVVAALQDGTVVGGDQLVLSRNTAGAVMTAGGGTTDVASLVGEQNLGYCIQTGATTEWVTMYLILE